ncbi:hypothetical protein QFC22_000673 [Naganishia vaughanmartiniae]|uniref:Uncharacterized protein n=1 Tax=Naganishia vaughanmartiniae TaxID=1424756 RepID=A0ACC2XKH8_9TREE|nr:hypothetical protein QFC22_000673 [Naganishia vaughanmartiniae]
MDLPQNRRPRPSLAIFDPLASIDITLLPPIPSTPPSVSPSSGHARYFLLDSTPLAIPHGRQIGGTGLASFLPDTNTIIQKPGKLVDIVTPMPIVGRTLHSSATRPRDVVPPSGGDDRVDTVSAVRSVDMILEEEEEEEQPQTMNQCSNEYVVGIQDDPLHSRKTAGLLEREGDDQVRITPIQEEELYSETPTTALRFPERRDTASLDSGDRFLSLSPSRSSSTTQEAVAAAPQVETTLGVASEPVPASPQKTMHTPLRVQQVKNDVNDNPYALPQASPQANEIYTANSDTPVPTPSASTRASNSEGDTSRFPALCSHPDRGDKKAGGTTTSVMTVDLMDEDQSFMEAMMMGNSFSPSSSPSANDDTVIILSGAGVEVHSPQRMAAGGGDIEATSMMGRWKGEGRAMDLPTTTDSSSSIVRSTHGEEQRMPDSGVRTNGGATGDGKTSVNGFGSVLAGMAEYEATITRPHPIVDNDQNANDAEERRNSGHLTENSMRLGVNNGVTVMVSKASDSPSSLATLDSRQAHKERHSSLMATTSRLDNGLLAVHRQPLTTAAGEEGDISTIFPSSPSIKRYMNTQRAEERARTHVRSRSTVPGSSLFRSHLDDADTSRLDMVDLSDLRKPTQIDGAGRNVAEESVAFLDTSMMVHQPRRPRQHQHRERELDRSTIYPSSPAVKRNMEQCSMTVDLLRDDIGLGDLGTMDSRLEQSVMMSSLETRNGTRSEMLAPLVENRYLATTASSSGSRSTTRPTATSSTHDTDGDTWKPTKDDDKVDTGDQTLDIGALIKKTSRKLASDMRIADSTISGSDFLGLGDSRSGNGGSRGERPEMSMLLDIESPFKPRAREGDSRFDVREGRRADETTFAPVVKVDEESYYDLLGDDNTFMKEVGDVTVGGETLMISPVKGNILPPALLNRAPPAASSHPAARSNFQFKVPELPRGFSPSRSSGSNSAAHKTSPSTSPVRQSRALPETSRRLSPVRATPTSDAYSLPPVTPARLDRIDKASTTRKFVPTSTKTTATPRSTAGSEYRRPTVPDHSSVGLLPPRTPLAERGYGPQSAKKTSTSSVTSVLHETHGRAINTRDPTKLVDLPKSGTTIKRSATLNDFTPVKNRETQVESTVAAKRYPVDHARTRTDASSLSRNHLASTSSGVHKRPTTVSTSPSRIGRMPNPTTATATSRPSQIRLPGQGLRQVSGQQEAENPDARSRKQAMSPDKLIKGTSLPRTEGIARRPSPPRMRTGFRPTPTQREGSTLMPERSTDRQKVAIPSRSQSSVALAAASRSGSSTSIATARSSGLPPRSSASSSSNQSRVSSQPAPRFPLNAGARIPAASAASLAGKTTTGLPRPTGGVRPNTNQIGSSATSIVRPGSTASNISNGRVAAPLAARPSTTTTSSTYRRTGIVTNQGLVAPKREITDVPTRIERPRQQAR